LEKKAGEILISTKTGKSKKENHGIDKLFEIIADYVGEMQQYLMGVTKDYIEHSAEYLVNNHDSKVAEYIAKKIFGDEFNKSITNDIAVLDIIKGELGHSKNTGRQP